MQNKLIKGKEVSLKVQQTLKKRVEELKRNSIIPGLAVVLIGDDPASAIYVRSKEKKFLRRWETNPPLLNGYERRLN